MIALKDISKMIKKGDEVTILRLSTGYCFIESFKDGEYRYKDKLDSLDLYNLFRDLTEEENLVGHCESCECEILRGEEFLTDGDEENDEIYCRGCVEEYTVTSFVVGGEYLASDDDGWGFETK